MRLYSLSHKYFNTIGPGVARSDDVVIALIVAELNVNAGSTPFFLIPVERTALVNQVYSWGARNFDITFTQVKGHFQDFCGVNFPGFLPESA